MEPKSTKSDIKIKKTHTAQLPLSMGFSMSRQFPEQSTYSTKSKKSNFKGPRNKQNG